ncbi:hypothetical protein MRX96_059905 [Rhipicephalus microplus]
MNCDCHHHRCDRDHAHSFIRSELVLDAKRALRASPELTTMQHRVPMNPTYITTRQGGVFNSAASETTFTANYNPTTRLVPAADVAAPRVSLGQLTYSVESGPTAFGQDKALSRETSYRRPAASKRRKWMSEAQLAAARPHAAPPGQTAGSSARPNAEQRRLLRGNRARTSPRMAAVIANVGKSVSKGICS